MNTGKKKVLKNKYTNSMRISVRCIYVDCFETKSSKSNTPFNINTVGSVHVLDINKPLQNDVAILPCVNGKLIQIDAKDFFVCILRWTNRTDIEPV